MEGVAVSPYGQGSAFWVRVVPRASRTELAGVENGDLKIRLAAPPVGGAANAQLVRFLADILRVGRSGVSIQAGLKSKRKRVVVGLGVEELTRRLGLMIK